MAAQELKIRKPFATPILLTHLDDAPVLNQELLAHILPRAQREGERRHINLGGWQSADDFHMLELPAARTLCREVNEVVNAATAVSGPQGLLEPAFEWRINA